MTAGFIESFAGLRFWALRHIATNNPLSSVTLEFRSDAAFYAARHQWAQEMVPMAQNSAFPPEVQFQDGKLTMIFLLMGVKITFQSREQHDLRRS